MDTMNKEDVFEYLDCLRESGITNMYGAVPYIQEEFNCKRTEASVLLGEWMKTFNKRHAE